MPGVRISSLPIPAAAPPPLSVRSRTIRSGARAGLALSAGAMTRNMPARIRPASAAVSV
jgi:hypothetical protein